MFLSVIVPIFNNEKYLRECLDSVIVQDISLEEYEVICIDDGSVDSSSRIVEDYANRCSNVQLVNKKNNGVSSARNIGLSLARGDWILMVDSDDFIQPRIFSDLQELVAKTACDYVKLKWYEFQNELSLDDRVLLSRGLVIPNCDYCEAVAAGFLLRMSVIGSHDLRFEKDVRYTEDGLFMFEFSRHSESNCEFDKTAYYYRKHCESAMAANTEDSIIARYDSYRITCKKLKRYYDIDRTEKSANIYMQNIWFLLELLTSMKKNEMNLRNRELRDIGILPVSKPTECTVEKSYQTTRTDFVGRLYDWTYLHLHKWYGFAIMRGWKIIRQKAKS